MSSFIAQFRINRIDLLDVSFSINPEGPKGPVRVEINLDHNYSGIQLNKERNDNTAIVTLFIKTEMKETDNTENTLMSGQATLRGVFSFPEVDDKPPANELESWMLQNGITALYSHARSLFSYLASSSPMGQFMIPPVYVQDYLDMKATGETTDSNKNDEESA